MLASLQVPQLVNSPSNFAQLQFSMDGQKLLAVCDGNIYVLDAFNGSFMTSMNNGVPESGAARQACFSCDSSYVLSGERAWLAVLVVVPGSVSSAMVLLRAGVDAALTGFQSGAAADVAAPATDMLCD